MRNFYLLLGTAVLLLAQSCAPKVLTRVQKSYPALDANAPVAVFGIEELPPQSAERLGSVEVKDTGFSNNCTYPQVIGLASSATREAGGNALHLTYHRKPSAWGSTCHRIGGWMLHIPDSDSTLNLSAHNAAAQAETYRQTPVRPRAQIRRTTLHVSPGYGFITSKMKVLDGITGNFKEGFHLDAGIDRVSRSGLGGGVRYAGLFTKGSYSDMVERGAYLMRLHYVAPEFVARTTTRSGKWGFHAAIGFGYARYTEQWKSKSESLNGIGFHAGLGAEYRITRYVGLGIQAMAYSTRFKMMDDLVGQLYDDNTKGGIEVIAVNGGIRFYF